MDSERKIFIQDVGEVTIRKRRHVKRLNISINKNGEIRMTIPRMVSYHDAELFLAQKKKWMVRTLQKIEARTAARKFTGEGIVMETKFHRILVQRNGDPSPFFKINAEETRVCFPYDADISKDEMQAFIRRAITETLRKEALDELIPRTRALGEMYGFEINGVRVKDLKSRWGSCSMKNNINLNIHLMRLPSYLADYVILHELVHTIHHNHSPAFWDELGKYVNDPRKMAKQLRNYSTEIG